ncbi:MAG: succinylglutamate desuccinylase/aspartoacylase family protein, partial [Verrucomicrobiota bacterium]|nr:succinylglutamate desuccinylase/aspartoacylase family protein [Verrucomicrobiota bacterium]
MRVQQFLSVALFLLLPGPAGGEIASGILAAGTKWETPYHVIEGSQPGPTVFLAGGLHGNEPAGARAAEQIRHWPILRGRLVVLPQANQPGLRAGTRHLPELAKAEADLNRNFPRTGAGDEASSIVGKAIWTLVQKLKPDWVIDLHEGYHFHQIQSKSVGSTILASRPGDQRTRPVVTRMLAAVNATIADPGKHFVPLRGTANGSLTRAAAERLGSNSLILETTTREQPLSLRTRQHRLMVRALFENIGMVPKDAPTMTRPRGEDPALRVALYDSGGVGGSGPRNVQEVMKTIPRSLTWRVGPSDIREGVLAHFEVVIFPGGSGSKQAAALGIEGRDQVRAFVERGGGFVGICAGAYLAAANYQWSLKIGDYKTFCEAREIPGIGRKSMWYRGPSSTVEMELTNEGRRILGDRVGPFPVRYHNGP